MKSGVWLHPQTLPALAQSELHVWRAHLPTARAQLQELGLHLSLDEQERIARFRLTEHRERSQLTRGLLRRLLAHYAGLDPSTLHFTYNAHGKPELPHNDVCFNTSHSGDYAVFAFTRAGRVGVDIERVRTDMKQHDSIAGKHFAPGERAQLGALPEDERVPAFFDLWARKEAFVKARGDGLFSGLDQFETLLEKPRVLTVGGTTAVDWWMSDLPETQGYAGAVVVNAGKCDPQFRDWNSSLR